MSTLRANNLTRASGSGVPDLGGVAANRLLPSAWVNFNGTGVVAIRDSHNVAGITDNGVGDYKVNFATPMSNSNYTVASNCGAGAVIAGAQSSVSIWGAPPSISGVRVSTTLHGSGGNTLSDSVFVTVVIFGGCA